MLTELLTDENKSKIDRFGAKTGRFSDGGTSRGSKIRAILPMEGGAREIGEEEDKAHVIDS
jgi:hypothetical protein